MFSDKDTNKQKSFLARMVAAVAMISLAYVLIVMTPEGYRQTLQAEINAFKSVVGPTDSAHVLQNAADMYSYAFLETGVVSSMEESVQITGVGGEEFWRTPMIRIVENLKLMFYQTVFRMAVFFHWLILGAPFIFALASDGYYKRKTKQYEFGIASANLFRIWVKAGMFAFFIIDVYFIFPAAGVFGVLLPPIMFVILGFSLRYALSNVSKVF
ncbi:DUF4400 domain-containing protein [Vibrio cholerae]|uniref:Uncharacterized protein n=1 Tax=Vibrio parahaemolyticus TaxID=670 RepID=A0A1B1LR78_VIBPH|nr:MULTISPECIES: DUF4400 domain-containing protein [Vibrio]EJL6490522.1 DUF4400 domain-containing protein [Vibrio cholerae]ANS55562.1 hypothetical protein [Vibrio parahaemolyticus]EJL6642213.1 DUF4400 domain-containing protein [Vibrio cholerae]MCI9701227.1 DUF4400 domain-containing protein [Vibrio parahaemolyticus]MCR9814209.1 DUF4400 domain-containing protein [Vibrio parahaemolyticus]